MKKLCIGLMVFILVLVGCNGDKSDLSIGLKLRQQMMQGEGCSFRGEITADYGDRTYSFTMDCLAKPTGDVEFEIIHPDSLQGICGTVSQVGGKLTFDDVVLLFEPLMNGQVTPVIGPWLMVKAIQGGYIQSVAGSGEDKELIIDDTFGAEKYRSVLSVGKDGVLKFCEIFWNNRRILTFKISNFGNA